MNGRALHGSLVALSLLVASACDKGNDGKSPAAAPQGQPDGTLATGPSKGEVPLAPVPENVDPGALDAALRARGIAAGDVVSRAASDTSAWAIAVARRDVSGEPVEYSVVRVRAADSGELRIAPPAGKGRGLDKVVAFEVKDLDGDRVDEGILVVRWTGHHQQVLDGDCEGDCLLSTLEQANQLYVLCGAGGRLAPVFTHVVAYESNSSTYPEDLVVPVAEEEEVTYSWAIAPGKPATVKLTRTRNEVAREHRLKGVLDPATDPLFAAGQGKDVTLAVGCGQSGPATGKAPCTAEAVRHARKAAQQLVKRGDHRSASGTLERFLASCDLDTGRETSPNLDYFWVQSDLSFIAYKAGDHVECLRILAPLTTPKPPLSIHEFGLEETKVGKAILHNEELCSKASSGRRKEFQKLPCRLAGEDETATGLSADVLPAGAQAGCLVLKASAGPAAFAREMDGSDDEATRLCGDLVLRTTRPGARAPTETRLSATEGPLEDESTCCNLDKVSFAAAADVRQIRVQGGGLDCFGGTADSDLDAIYGWLGDKLTLEQNDSVARH